MLAAEENQGPDADTLYANEALREIVESLTDDSDLDTYIERVLLIVANRLQSPLVEYWVHDTDEMARLAYTCKGGRFFIGSEIPNDPRTKGLRINLASFDCTSLYARTSTTVLGDQPWLQSVCNLPVPIFDLERWGSERDASALINVPLVANGKAFGALAVFGPSLRKFPASRIALATAIARQLTLALRLLEVVDESRTLAVLKEQTRAAQEREAEISKAHSALRRGVERIANEPNRDRLLQSFLIEAIQELGAAAGGIMLKVPEKQNAFEMKAVFTDHFWSDEEVSADPFLSRYQMFSEEDAVGTYSRLARGITVFLNIEDIRHRAPVAYAFHKRVHSKTVFYMPFHLRDQMIGFTALTFADDRKVSESARDLLVGLSQQLVLGLELFRLAEESRQAAIVREQQKTAVELHDTLAGAFTAIYMQLEASFDLAGFDERKRRSCIERAATLAQNGLQQVRDVVHLLASNGEVAPGSLQELRDVVLLNTAGTSTHGSFIIHGPERPLRATVTHTLLRILQEAVGNAQRYAKATNIRVKLCFEEEGVVLEIQDDGIGFVPSEATMLGFGIVGMQTRATRLDGGFWLTSAPGAGTHIRIDLPSPYAQRRETDET